jgi:hypothetical protein
LATLSAEKHMNRLRKLAVHWYAECALAKQAGVRPPWWKQALSYVVLKISPLRLNPDGTIPQ